MFFQDPKGMFAEAGLRNSTKFAGGRVEKDIFQYQFDDTSWCTRINILVFLYPLEEHTTNGWKKTMPQACAYEFTSGSFTAMYSLDIENTCDFFKVLEPWYYGILWLIVCQLYLTKRQEPERR